MLRTPWWQVRYGAIERLAQAVLDARDQFPGSTLADLYDPLTMPPALARAHAALDRAVDRLYRKEPFETDADRVALLFERYLAVGTSSTLVPTTPEMVESVRRP